MALFSVGCSAASCAFFCCCTTALAASSFACASAWNFSSASSRCCSTSSWPRRAVTSFCAFSRSTARSAPLLRAARGLRRLRSLRLLVGQLLPLLAGGVHFLLQIGPQRGDVLPHLFAFLRGGHTRSGKKGYGSQRTAEPRSTAETAFLVFVQESL